MKEIIIATSNKNKIKEYREMLEPLNYHVKSLEDFAPIEINENGDSFEDNALIKAKTLFEHTHLTCIADDSGLEIRALDNKPGIYSARWLADKSYYEKNETIIELLKNQKDRYAKFNCAIAYVSSDITKVFKGELEGEIALNQRGDNGFGYDPIFLIPSLNKTNAELTPEHKNAISHRGLATKQLLEFLNSIK